MVSSLKGTHTQQLDLYIGSKEFLRVFTDAANHIPRHRRTKSVNLPIFVVQILTGRQLFRSSCQCFGSR